MVHIGAMQYGLGGYEGSGHDALHTAIEYASLGLLFVHFEQARIAVQLQGGVHNAFQDHGKRFHTVRLYSVQKYGELQ